MPKRKAAQESVAETPAKKEKLVKQQASGKRGRPPLSSEEKAKRAAEKESNKSGRGRGRPKGSKNLGTRLKLPFLNTIRKPNSLLFNALNIKKSPISDEDRFADVNFNGDLSGTEVDDTHLSQRDFSTVSSTKDEGDVESSNLSDDESKDQPVNSDTLGFTAQSDIAGSSLIIENVTGATASQKTAKIQKSKQQKTKTILSQEELDVLKLKKEKLAVQIEVLYLQKRILLYKLEKIEAQSPPSESGPSSEATEVLLVPSFIMDTKSQPPPSETKSTPPLASTSTSETREPSTSPPPPSTSLLETETTPSSKCVGNLS